MNRRPRSAAVPLILLLVIALAAGMLMGAARAKADPPVNHGQDRGVPPGVKVVPPAPADPANPGQDNGTLPGATAVLPVPDFVTPDLGAVPDVVKVKSTKHAAAERQVRRRADARRDHDGHRHGHRRRRRGHHPRRARLLLA